MTFGGGGGADDATREDGSGDDGGAVAGSGGAGRSGVGGEAQTAGVVSGRWQGGGGGAALTGPWERGHGGRPRRDRDLPSPVSRPTTQGHPRASRHARPRLVTARGPPGSRKPPAGRGRYGGNSTVNLFLRHCHVGWVVYFPGSDLRDTRTLLSVGTAHTT